MKELIQFIGYFQLDKKKNGDVMITYSRHFYDETHTIREHACCLGYSLSLLSRQYSIPH